MSDYVIIAGWERERERERVIYRLSLACASIFQIDEP